MGEDQLCSLQHFLLFTSLGDNPYKPHTSLVWSLDLEREEDSYLFYNTFNTPRLQDIIHTFMPFHVEKSGVFIGPNGFKIGAKKCLILDFRGTGGTIAIIGWYYCL